MPAFTTPTCGATGPSRNIVLFSDGTGNSSSSLFKTNVRRLYEALDLTDPTNPQHPRQFAYYDDGVGTSTFRPLAILGGAFGYGLTRNILDLYAFLCRTWRPGDRVYGFGFSRGAFTIRVVTGLIMHQGVVGYDGDEATLQRNVRAAYRAYRRERYWNLNPLVPLLRGTRDLVIEGWNRAWHRTSYSMAANRGRPRNDAIDARGRSPDDLPVEVQFLGVWDTVDAYGLPIEELTRAVDLVLWPLTMPDGDLNTRVRRACHALCLDDKRRTFHPRLWNELPHPTRGGGWGGVKGENTTTMHIREERITQLWFAGMHADVGGGYADDSLAHVSLKWMMDEAEHKDLRFTKAVRDRLEALADENGPIHDSRRGLASYYRYQPRHVGRLSTAAPLRSGSPLAWLRRRLGRYPVSVPRPKIHESVFRRLWVGQDGYAPISLPAHFAIARIEGEIVDCDVFLTTPDAGDKPKGGAGNSLEDSRAEKAAAPAATSQLSLSLVERVKWQEHVWNWVWRRRVVYFATLLTTLALVAMPLYRPTELDAACEGALCVLSPAIGVLAALLPGSATLWVTSFTAHPGTFAALAVIIALLIWRGKVLERRVSDEMRCIWYRYPKLAPQTGLPSALPALPSLLNRSIEWFRSRVSYQRGWQLLTGYFLPGLAFFVSAYLGLALLNNATYALRESWVGLCHRSGERSLVTDKGATGTPLRTSEPCNPTGLNLQAGATYALRLTVPVRPDEERWRDKLMPAGPNGIRPEDLSWYMSVFAPLRRHVAQNWFRLMARIGEQGSDSYVLHWRLVSEDTKEQIYQTELTARRDDELFLYVNDISVVLDPRWFHDNNYGSAVPHATLLARRYPLAR